MKVKFARVTRLGAGTIAIAATAVLAAGCSSKDNFAKVNGQVITKEEYIEALERAPVSIPGSPQPAQVNAARFALDQIVGRKVVQAEASRAGVLPSENDVKKRFEVQKRIFEQQMPGKSFEAAMKEQGTTPAGIQDEIKSQMAETNLLASQMKITDQDLKKAYDSEKNRYSLPERVQIRVIVAPTGRKDFAQAQKMLSDKTDFAEVAKQVNIPQLKATGGLVPQPTPVAGVPPAWRSKLKQTAEGAYFGPVDWPARPGQPAAKAWIKVEKKFPPFTLPYEDAKPLIKQGLVQARVRTPQNANIGRDLVMKKLRADFQAADPKYQTMWQTAKDAAKAAGAGQETNTPVTSMPAPGG